MLKKRGLVTAGLCCCVSILGWVRYTEAAPGKVTICHTADRVKYLQITVASRAVPSHIAHGDCVVDDGVPCTVDRCDADLGCVHAPDNSLCDDVDACTDDVCDASPVSTGCVYTPVSCDDGNACTADSCDPSAGCQYADRLTCGNGACDCGEDASTCPGDCPCGDGDCGIGENASNCPADCGCAAPGACGTQAPDGCFCDCVLCANFGDCCPDAEAACNISVDACCGDGECLGAEDAFTCPEDCGCAAPGACGTQAPDGCFCDCVLCANFGDCCPDAEAACPNFCCGNGDCDFGENLITCPEDCAIIKP